MIFIEKHIRDINTTDQTKKYSQQQNFYSLSYFSKIRKCTMPSYHGKHFGLSLCRWSIEGHRLLAHLGGPWPTLLFDGLDVPVHHYGGGLRGGWSAGVLH